MLSPCKDCKFRQKPKLCENNCKLWKEYKNKKEMYDNRTKLSKTINHLNLFRRTFL